jgi:Ran GTPase-activating protein (RanGAP) involved in mRNA processing and transport
LAASAITTSVFRTNPVLDEVLYAINAIKDNDPQVTVLDVKDFPLTNQQGLALAESLKANTHVTHLNLANASIQTAVVVELAKALKFNHTVTHLNLEGNQIGPQGMKELAFCLGMNTSIQELKLAYQKSITSTGQEAEHAFADAMQKNMVLVKLGLAFKNAACRDRVHRAITRNQDLARKARLASN